MVLEEEYEQVCQEIASILHHRLLRESRDSITTLRDADPKEGSSTSELLGSASSSAADDQVELRRPSVVPHAEDESTFSMEGTILYALL